MPEAQETIGVILVHGIGEQRRFEHLETQGRLLIEAFRRLPDTQISVEILQAPGGVHYAEQNTWASSPSVRIGLKDPRGYREILLHEVWWADVNEPYSLAKQFRFWLWGLSIWSYPRKATSSAAGFEAMAPPSIPNFGATRRLIVRFQLFGVSTLFLMAACPLGLGVVLAKRLLNLSAPDFVETLVNYVSGVKLYNQRSRRGSTLFANSDGDFIDTMKEPPRVSVRRRMVETMIDVALQHYSRWYVLAHSLGTVVAQNGLMEPAETLAHYLGREKWELLREANLGGQNPVSADGKAAYFNTTDADDELALPRRPTWLAASDVVFRDRILSGFRGLLTYGSPLEKFAALWPARVGINRIEPHFPAEAEWINVYDPIDPVSGVLRAFDPYPGSNLVPRLTNIGYKADRLLLYAHLRYLTMANSKGKNLGDAVAYWIAHGEPFRVPEEPRSNWYEPYDWQHLLRKWTSAAEWFAVACVIALIGGWFVSLAYRSFSESLQSGVHKLFTALPGFVRNGLGEFATALMEWIDSFSPSWFAVLGTAVLAILMWALSEFCEKHSARKIGCTVIRWVGIIILAAAVGSAALLLIRWLQAGWPILAWSLEFATTCAAITLLVGGVANLFFFRRDRDDPDKHQIGTRRPREHAFRPSSKQFGLSCAEAAEAGTLKHLLRRMRSR